MRVSIIIPTYNRPDFLDRLLSSIRQQTFQDFEIIIINDNSDNLGEYDKIISKYKNLYKDLIYVINDTNRGAPYSRNIGIDKSKYELIALVDDDDEWLPNKLEKQVEVFKHGSKNLGLVYTWTYVSSNDKLYEGIYNSTLAGDVIKNILKECFIPSPSVMVKKEVIVNAGKFDEDMPSCQDWDMWTRIFLNGNSCEVIKEYLTIYHKHDMPTIGLSKNALEGYKMYYSKNLRNSLKYFHFFSFLRRYFFILRN